MTKNILLSVGVVAAPRVGFPRAAVSGPVCHYFVVVFVRPPVFNGIVAGAVEGSSGDSVYLVLRREDRGAIGDVVSHSISACGRGNSVAVVDRNANRSFRQSGAFKLCMIGGRLAIFRVTACLVPALLDLATSNFQVVGGPPSI